MIAGTLFGVIGVALGYITRSTIAAVVGAVGWVLFAELAILHTWPRTWPSGWSQAPPPPSPTPPRSAAGTLTPATAVAVLSGYTVLLLAVASRLVLRRDVP